MPRALLSVSDKTGITELAAGLVALGWDLVASGGTQAALEASGLQVVPIERVTSSSEMLGGRVKTLHPAIHAGILARDSDQDYEELRNAGYAPIDLVVCNLYPFQQTTQQADTSLEQAIEKIDIGGVTLLRGAAKNFQRVAVVIDPTDYPRILDELRDEGRISLATRRELAIKAFAHTRDYDTAIHAYLTHEHEGIAHDVIGEGFAVGTQLTHPLRYGENPHQKAGFYAATGTINPLYSQQLGGKALSYNNILDADGAWRAASAFDASNGATVVVVKHLTPTGICTADSPAEALSPALKSDPLSAFGGVIAVNQGVDTAFVDALGDLFIEAIIAPDFEDEAVAQLISGRKNCRLLKINHTANPLVEFRSVLGGVLVQERDAGDPSDTQWKVVSERQPSQDELASLMFAWKAVEQVKSNAIVLAAG